MATKSEITTLESKPAESAVASSVVAAKGLPGASGERVILTIFSNSGLDGDQDVNCGINGYTFQIQRDQPVNVPAEVAEMFRNAVTTTYVKGVPMDRPRFAFSATPV